MFEICWMVIQTFQGIKQYIQFPTLRYLEWSFTPVPQNFTNAGWEYENIRQIGSQNICIRQRWIPSDAQ